MPWGDSLIPSGRTRVEVKKVDDAKPEDPANEVTPEPPTRRYRPPGWSRETSDQPSRRKSVAGWGHE